MMQESTEAGRATRRGLLLGAGAVGAGAVLAACGSDDADDPGTGSGGPTGSAPTGEPAGSGTKLAKTSDIPVGGGAIFASQGVVVTQPTEGTFKGFSSICTHQNCPVSSVEGGTINCNCHKSTFSIEDGSVKSGPAPKPLGEKAITQDGDSILLG